jgi:hypothetical protein
LDTVKARNSWREFFVQVVNDNGIAHLDGVKILDDPTPINLPCSIALKRGGVQTILAGHFAPKQYLDPCPTFEVVINACNEALDSKLTVDQIADRFIDLIPAIPPKLVGKSRWDFEKQQRAGCSRKRARRMNENANNWIQNRCGS